MKSFSELISSGQHKDIGLAVLRIYLGAGLLVRGVLFLMNMDALASMVMQAERFQALTTLIVHYVGLAHIAGGFLMMIGMGTRVAAALQVPVLFGAVFFVHLKEGLFTTGQSLELSALVLVMLIVFSFCGSGIWSVDQLIEQKKSEG